MLVWDCGKMEEGLAFFCTFFLHCLLEQKLGVCDQVRQLGVDEVGFHFAQGSGGFVPFGARLVDVVADAFETVPVFLCGNLVVFQLLRLGFPPGFFEFRLLSA